MTLEHQVDVAIGVIKVHETGRWAHINVKLLHYCSCYDNYREELNTKARGLFDRWDDLSDIVKLSKLFHDMTRILAKYVKNIYLMRRNKIYNH